MKKIIIILLLIMIIFPLNIKAENTKEGSSMLDSRANNFKVLALNLKEIEGKKYFSLRSLGEAYDWSFDFNTQEKRVYINSNNSSYDFKVNGEIELNDKKAKAIIKDNRIYLELTLINSLLDKMDELEVQLLTSFKVEKNELKKDEDIKAIMEIYNISENNIRLHFSSGQLYDLYLRKAKKEVWRWSEGKFFTMAIQYKDLESGEKLSYEETVPGQKSSGEYVLGGKITAQSEIPFAEVEITVK